MRSKQSGLLRQLETWFPSPEKFLCGGVLWPGAQIRPEWDMALACYGHGDLEDRFDWYSGYLPYVNANETVFFSFKNIAATADVPVLAGINATDPFFTHEQLLGRLRDIGLCAVVNYPSIGLIDGDLRRTLEREGMGMDREIAFLSKAKKEGFYSLGLAVSLEDALKMVNTSPDAVALYPARDEEEGCADGYRQYMENLFHLRKVMPQGTPLLAIGPSVPNLHALVHSLQFEYCDGCLV